METVPPESVGLSSERLARISKVMQAYVDQGKLAGIQTVVARRGKLAHQACFGLADLEASRPMTTDTIFRIYSMTKPITSVAVMMLLEAGHLQLDHPVSAYLPEFGETKVFVKKTEAEVELTEQAQPMTIEHLLTHTSGLPYDDPEGSPVEVMHYQALPNWSNVTLREGVHKLAKLPLMFQPGSAWHYGTSYEILGYLVEVASGMPFDKFLREKILEPLGMVDTAFYVPEKESARLAAVYGPAGVGLKRIDNEDTKVYSDPPRAPKGGNGLLSSAADYLRFCHMLLNRGELGGVRLLGRKTVELMTMNRLTPQQLVSFRTGQHAHIASEQGFGLGFQVMTDASQVAFLGSEGEYFWGGGATTLFWIDPREEMICLFLTQFQPLFHYAVEWQFKNLAYQAIID